MRRPIFPQRSALSPTTRDKVRDEIDRAWRRIDRLMAADRGAADVRFVPVKGTVIPRHHRAAHDRAIITVRKGK